MEAEQGRDHDRLTRATATRSRTATRSLTDIWIGNGFTQEQAYSTYDERQPEPITVTTAQPGLPDAIKGQKSAPGSRSPRRPRGLRRRRATRSSASATRTPSWSSSTWCPQVLDGPEGEEQAAPAWAPDAREQDGDVTGLDFTGTPKPDGKLRLGRLIKGTGAKVEEGPDHHGPLPRPGLRRREAVRRELQHGEPDVVRHRHRRGHHGLGQDAGRRPVGTRVILAIPPDRGYGDEGSPTPASRAPTRCTSSSTSSPR